MRLMNKKNSQEDLPAEKINISSCETQLLEQSEHREGVTFCPSCDYRFERKEGGDLAAGFRGWLKPSVIKEVILESQKYYKKDAVIAISQCPKCFEYSWVHVDASTLLYSYNREGQFGYNKELAGKLEEIIKKKKRKK